MACVKMLSFGLNTLFPLPNHQLRLGDTKYGNPFGLFGEIMGDTPRH